MRALPSPLRKQLETAVLSARRAAEGASRAAIDGLGVFQRDKPAHLDADRAGLRNGLRAKWRQLGGGDAAQSLLIAECAYEQWHQLLFARFLAENGLLIHPRYKAPVTLTDCADLAAELGEPDGWSVAARFAADILPGIFRLDDPCVRLRLAPEGRHALEQLLDGLPAEVFAADDALGWVYQFWQKDKKDEVNNSERKIGGADLGPVTQLFTENYMVRFLLENSLGAWWVARHPDSPLVKGFDFLRFDEDGKPAAGSFDDWPDRVAEVTVMDPCCGSGHFLVEAFSMLWRMRAEEDALSPVEAQDAVLRDSLFGLELDPRCVQIAMFAVALQAWKAGEGWRQLPVPMIACSGIPVKASVEEWRALAGGDQRLENALVRLHVLFRDADTLGSLIDPPLVAELTSTRGHRVSLDAVAWEDVGSLLRLALDSEDRDPASAVLHADASAIALAADLLSREYSLVTTNVPYLGRGSQSKTLREFCERHYQTESADLATVVAARCHHLGRTSSLVLPANWLFMYAYASAREQWLSDRTWSSLAWLGAGAFREVTGEVVRACLWTTHSVPPAVGSAYVEVDVSEEAGAGAKERTLVDAPLTMVSQLQQLSNDRFVVVPGGFTGGPAIKDIAEVKKGLSTGDAPIFIRGFWEVPDLGTDWLKLQSAPGGTRAYSGCSLVILWEEERGRLAAWAASVRHLNHAAQAWRQGIQFWGRPGVAMKLMGKLEVSLYTGEAFDSSVAVITPQHQADLRALWGAAQAGELEKALRRVHSKVSVESDTILNTPFDLDHWRKVAADAAALPDRWSDDPAQWLFEGRPEVSTAPLQVAVARLLGYRWPEQAASDDLDGIVDVDGIVCLPSVAGEAPAADRVQQLLAKAFGEAWSPARVRDLLEQAGSKKRNLADWLRDEFFKQHCALFGYRPFIWHIWDGQLDGFSALVNYHRLDRRLLEKLTYGYLGQDWVERLRDDVRDEVAGAEARLSAALKLQRRLEAIIDGERPYDIYARWKELHEQPVGWEPDLNDGVRLNIRPFVEAGVLRAPFNIHWRKDRGKNPDGTERHNDIHLTLAEKTDARKRAGRA